MGRSRTVDLNALRSFIAVVTHGGFAPASRRLGTPKSTLSRHVRELEASLGVRLLERGPRGFRLTAEGDALSERGARGLAEIDDVERSVRAAEGPARGPLRVAVPHVFAHRQLGRLAAAFHAAHPDVLLEAIVADGPVDLVAEGVDVAIVLDPPDSAELVVRRLATEELVMVSPPALARERRRGRVPVEAPWPAVVPSRPAPSGERFEAPTVSRTWELVEAGRSFRVIARPVLRLPSKLAIRDAVLEGAGAALLPSSLVDEPLRAKQLVRVGALRERHVLSIVHSSSRLVSARARAFIDAVVRSWRRGPGA